MMSKRLIATLATISLALAASACNTIDGAGEDLDSVGEEIEEEL